MFGTFGTVNLDSTVVVTDGSGTRTGTWRAVSQWLLQHGLELRETGIVGCCDAGRLVGLKWQRAARLEVADASGLELDA